MTSHAPKPTPEQSYQTILIVWAALLFSQVLFIPMVLMIKPELMGLDLSKPLLGSEPVVSVALAAVSVVALIASFILRKKILARSVDQQDVSLVQTAVIVGCALCESVSLFGFLTAFLFEYQYFFLFSAAGIGGTLLHFPRRDDVHAASYKK